MICSVACKTGFGIVRSNKTFEFYSCSADGVWYGLFGFGPSLQRVNLGVGGSPWPDCASEYLDYKLLLVCKRLSLLDHLLQLDTSD